MSACHEEPTQLHVMNERCVESYGTMSCISPLFQDKRSRLSLAFNDVANEFMPRTKRDEPFSYRPRRFKYIFIGI